MVYQLPLVSLCLSLYVSICIYYLSIFLCQLDINTYILLYIAFVYKSILIWIYTLFECTMNICIILLNLIRFSDLRQAFDIVYLFIYANDRYTIKLVRIWYKIATFIVLETAAASPRLWQKNKLFFVALCSGVGLHKTS